MKWNKLILASDLGNILIRAIGARYRREYAEAISGYEGNIRDPGDERAELCADREARKATHDALCEALWSISDDAPITEDDVTALLDALEAKGELQ